MNELRDPRAAGRRAIGATIAIAASLGLLSAVTVAGAAGYAGRDVIGLASLVFLVALIVGAVIAMRWIYLVATIAYALSGGETTRPGWAVGWYFVPFANLVKPYYAMREIYQVSENPADWPSVPGDYLPMWWGFWIATNILSNIAQRLDGFDVGVPAALVIELLYFGSAAVTAWMFIRLVREISANLAERIFQRDVAEIFV
ncbi:DUF4328 domain-containing protein [Sphingomonas sp.]|uniref:DUF4328 domain-containing protein n=1 Tax=Sphingomonas sp. TaxID=28214 RepID=UPI000DB556F5|nr:DUF4328 domain-containing protein [Sphingomonas sp.]PZU07199.1 MAG: hypothetical protein DI605_16190 [Sphingomonas sp.]